MARQSVLPLVGVQSSDVLPLHASRGGAVAGPEGCMSWAPIGMSGIARVAPTWVTSTPQSLSPLSVS